MEETHERGRIFTSGKKFLALGAVQGKTQRQQRLLWAKKEYVSWSGQCGKSMRDESGQAEKVKIWYFSIKNWL